MKVLIVDDEPGIVKLIGSILEDRCQVISAGSSAEAVKAIENGQPDVIISDIKMPGPDGLMLLQNIKSKNYDCPVIMITGHADKELVIQAVRYGAFDFIEKPFEDYEIISAVMRAFDVRKLKLENDLMSKKISTFETNLK